jgi:hypothetical protein
MTPDDRAFFESIINAGAILAGFCGTFIAFRIQREANYYRQPVLSYEEEKAKDIEIGLTHFTSSFLLIVLAALMSLLFGLCIPMLGLAGLDTFLTRRSVVAAGIVGAMALLVGYFVDELIHYGIIFGRLKNDVFEWKKETPVVIATILLAVVCMILVYRVLS